MTTTIGAYKVSARLPGAGETYLARSNRGERCIVRRLDKPDGGDWTEAEREIEVLAALCCLEGAHPAINAFRESFWHEGRLAVVALEHEGVTLDRVIARAGQTGEPIAPKAVWFVAHQVASALSLAHAAETPEGDFLPICHGYLSPKSIHVAWDGRVRVEGFGLASLLGVAGVRGERGYEAPELGSGGRITPRADIYALGAVVWALLAGRDAAAGRTGAELDFEAVADRVPEPLKEPLAQALQPALGTRRITSTELDQWFGDFSTGGQEALAAAVEPLKRSTNLMGTPRPAMPASSREPTAPRSPAPHLGSGHLGSGPTTRRSGEYAAASESSASPAPAPRPARLVGRPKLHPLESKQRTLLGGSEATGRSDVAGPPAVTGPAAGAGPGARPAALDLDDLDRAVDDVAESLGALRGPPSSRFDQRAAPPVPFDRPSPLAGLALDAEPLEGETPPELAGAVVVSDRAPFASTLASEPEPPPPAPPADKAVLLESFDDDEHTSRRAQSLAGSLASPPPEDAGASSTPSAPPSEPTPQPAPARQDDHLPPSSGPASSPWGPGSSAGIPIDQPLSAGKAVLVALLTAALVIGVGVWWRMRLANQVPASDPSATPAAAASPGPPSATTPTSRPTAAPTAATPTTEPTTAPTAATPTATPTSAPTSAPSATPTTAPTTTTGDATSDKGFIEVSFNGEQGGLVFFRHKMIGPVGQRLEVPCKEGTNGAVWMRIGKLPGPRWLTAGRTVQLQCGNVVKVMVSAGP